MNKIVIVEDKLGRAISLGEQLLDLSKTNTSLKIADIYIRYYCEDDEKAGNVISKINNSNLDIQSVNWFNFDEIMDSYIDSEQEQYHIIMDFMLEDDSFDGVPTRRVNIRYARNMERYKNKSLWFYTGTGVANEQILGQLIGEDHVLSVLEVDDNLLRLNLDKFIKNLYDCRNVEV